MYNGIGLTTPRGSGTNGHVQRNFAFVRPGKKDNVTYKSESDLAKLDALTNRPPNHDILDHERKRKVEVKCAEYEEILEKQGCTAEEVTARVDSFRKKLLDHKKDEIAKDEFGRVLVRDTHQIAEAQQEKNAKLREAFGISEYFVEGTSFDGDRKAKEDLAKSKALQHELQHQSDKDREKELENKKKYILVHTPSPTRENSDGKKDNPSEDEARKSESKKSKKKKSKKHKREKAKKKKSRKHDNSSDDSNDSVPSRKRRKSKHKKKDQKRKKRPSSSSPHEIKKSFEKGESKLENTYNGNDRKRKNVQSISEIDGKIKPKCRKSRSISKSNAYKKPKDEHYQSRIRSLHTNTTKDKTNVRDSQRSPQWNRGNRSRTPTQSKRSKYSSRSPSLCRDGYKRHSPLHRKSSAIRSRSPRPITDNNDSRRRRNNRTKSISSHSPLSNAGQRNRSDRRNYEDHGRNYSRRQPEYKRASLSQRLQFENGRNSLERSMTPLNRSSNRGDKGKAQLRHKTNSRDGSLDAANPLRSSITKRDTEMPFYKRDGEKYASLGRKSQDRIESITISPLKSSTPPEDISKPHTPKQRARPESISYLPANQTSKRRQNSTENPRANKSRKTFENDQSSENKILQTAVSVEATRRDSQSSSPVTASSSRLTNTAEKMSTSSQIDTKPQKLRNRSSSVDKRFTVQIDRNVYPTPVVRLHASSESNSENEQSDGKGNDLVRYVQNDERDKDCKLLKFLPGIAAKAKEKLKTITLIDSSQNLNSNIVQAKIIPDTEHAVTRAISRHLTTPTESSPKLRSRSPLAIASEGENRDRKGDHDLRYSSDSYSTHSDTSSRSSRSRYKSSSDADSKSSSSSESGTTPRTRSSSSRSPSIPRRRGSPSFLDRRRITSARKRPIPYHRPTPSSTSSDSEGAEESDQNHSSPYNLKECSNNLFQSIPNGNKSVYN